MATPWVGEPIGEGGRVVVNPGTSEVLGIGNVLGPYECAPEVKIVTACWCSRMTAALVKYPRGAGTVWCEVLTSVIICVPKGGYGKSNKR